MGNPTTGGKLRPASPTRHVLISGFVSDTGGEQVELLVFENQGNSPVKLRRHSPGGVWPGGRSMLILGTIVIHSVSSANCVFSPSEPGDTATLPRQNPTAHSFHMEASAACERIYHFAQCDLVGPGRLHYLLRAIRDFRDISYRSEIFHR